MTSICRVKIKVWCDLTREKSEENMLGFRAWVILVWFASIPLLVTSFEAKAEIVDDSGSWLGVFARGDTQQDSCRSRFKWWFDGHARFFDNTDGFGHRVSYVQASDTP